jgi:hypothetical protein
MPAMNLVGRNPPSCGLADLRNHVLVHQRLLSGCLMVTFPEPKRSVKPLESRSSADPTCTLSHFQPDRFTFLIISNNLILFCSNFSISQIYFPYHLFKIGIAFISDSGSE